MSLWITTWTISEIQRIWVRRNEWNASLQRTYSHTYILPHTLTGRPKNLKEENIFRMFNACTSTLGSDPLHPPRTHTPTHQIHSTVLHRHRCFDIKKNFMAYNFQQPYHFRKPENVFETLKADILLVWHAFCIHNTSNICLVYNNIFMLRLCVTVSRFLFEARFHCRPRRPRVSRAQSHRTESTINSARQRKENCHHQKYYTDDIGTTTR